MVSNRRVGLALDVMAASVFYVQQSHRDIKVGCFWMGRVSIKCRERSQRRLDTGDWSSSRRGIGKGLVVFQALSQRCFSGTFTEPRPRAEAWPAKGPVHYSKDVFSPVSLPRSVTLRLNIVSELSGCIIGTAGVMERQPSSISLVATRPCCAAPVSRPIPWACRLCHSAECLSACISLPELLPISALALSRQAQGARNCRGRETAGVRLSAAIMIHGFGTWRSEGFWNKDQPGRWRVLCGRH